MYGVRSPHLNADVYRLGNRSSVSTDYSETASFVSTAASTASSVTGDFYVLCLHDFEPTDDDQLGFRKGDILAILKVEDTGWWAAAMGSAIGWVPRGYVEPISDAMAETLKSVKRDMRSAASTTDDWDSASALGSNDNNGYASSSADPMQRPDEPWAHRRVSAHPLRYTVSTQTDPWPWYMISFCLVSDGTIVARHSSWETASGVRRELPNPILGGPSSFSPPSGIVCSPRLVPQWDRGILYGVRRLPKSRALLFCREHARAWPRVNRQLCRPIPPHARSLIHCTTWWPKEESGRRLAGVPERQDGSRSFTAAS